MSPTGSVTKYGLAVISCPASTHVPNPSWAAARNLLRELHDEPIRVADLHGAVTPGPIGRPAEDGHAHVRHRRVCASASETMNTISAAGPGVTARPVSHAARRASYSANRVSRVANSA